MQHKRYECYTNDTSMTRVKHFDFDNDASENIFSHSYISYMANERSQVLEQFHSKNYLLDMHCSQANIRLKSAPQKLNFVIAKAISKSYQLIVAANILACSHIVTDSNTASFSILFVKLTTFLSARNTKNYEKRMLDFERTFKIKVRSRCTVFEVSLTSAVI